MPIRVWLHFDYTYSMMCYERLSFSIFAVIIGFESSMSHCFNWWEPLISKGSRYFFLFPQGLTWGWLEGTVLGWQCLVQTWTSVIFEPYQEQIVFKCGWFVFLDILKITLLDIKRCGIIFEWADVLQGGSLPNFAKDGRWCKWVHTKY